MSTNRFDRKARDWDKNQMRHELAQAVRKALSQMPLHPDMRVMEFGCGTGLVGLPLAEKFGKLYGVDTSGGMLEVFKQKADEENITNIELFQSDISSLVLPEKLDLIFTSMTLHHIDDTETVLSGFYELLKPGGVVAIADLDAEDGSFHKAGSEEKHHGFERETLKKLLVELGFSPPSFTTVHTITRTIEDTTQKDFRVFLGIAKKPRL